MWVVGVFALGCGPATNTVTTLALRRHERKQQAVDEKHRRVAFQRRLAARAEELRLEAVDAAALGDCARVLVISHQLKAMPVTDIEAGYHDTVLLADPKVAECIARNDLVVTPVD